MAGLDVQFGGGLGLGGPTFEEEITKKDKKSKKKKDKKEKEDEEETAGIF